MLISGHRETVCTFPALLLSYSSFTSKIKTSNRYSAMKNKKTHLRYVTKKKLLGKLMKQFKVGEHLHNYMYSSLYMITSIHPSPL